MATYSWSIPTGKEITGTTFIKDTDNNLSDTIDDLVDFVNGEGTHAGQGLVYDLVDGTGDTMTGALNVPSGATGTEVPQAQEVLTYASNAGVAFDFYGATAPSGALSCSGQEVSKTTYALLYTAIGDLWATTGGASSPSTGNFRLPPQELNGKGLYNRGKISTTSVGLHEESQNESHTHTGGSHTHTGASHTHSIYHNHGSATSSSDSHNHTSSIPQKANAPGAGSNSMVDGIGVSQGNYTATTTTDSHSHTLDIPGFTGNSGGASATTTGSAGVVATTSSGGDETIPESITVLKCIWTGL